MIFMAMILVALATVTTVASVLRAKQENDNIEIHYEPAPDIDLKTYGLNDVGTSLDNREVYPISYSKLGI